MKKIFSIFVQRVVISAEIAKTFWWKLQKFENLTRLDVSKTLQSLENLHNKGFVPEKSVRLFERNATHLWQWGFQKISLLGVRMKNLLLGRHYICDFSGCNSELLLDSEQLHQVFVEIIEKSGLTIVDEGFHKFNPYGSTSFLLLAESHASIHTWPEYNYCAIDIFTCALEKDLQPVIVELQRRLGAEEASIRIVERNADVSVAKEFAFIEA